MSDRLENNANIFTKTIERHLKAGELKRHFGSREETVKTVKKVVALAKVMLPESLRRSDFRITRSEIEGVDLWRCSTFNIGILPTEAKFDFLLTQGKGQSKADLDALSPQEVLFVQPGSTTDKEEALPAFGLAQRDEKGELKVNVPFKENGEQNQIQHGGIAIKTNGELLILNYQEMNNILKETPNDIKIVYQADWYANSNDFSVLKNKANLKQDNTCNGLGQIALPNGQVRNFVFSFELGYIPRFFDILDVIKQDYGADNIRIAGLEFYNGEALMPLGNSEWRYLHSLNRPFRPVTNPDDFRRRDFIVISRPHDL